jgi:hypothetical protein
MNMHIFIAPAWQKIMARALSAGAGYGAATGAATLLVAGLGASVIGRSVAPLVYAIFFSATAAIVGALVGLACGLVGGGALAVLRRLAVRSRAAARLIAGSGAALLPATWLVLPYQSSDLLRMVAFTLTLVTFATGVARGPRVLYGKPRPRRRASSDVSGVRP